VIEILETKVDSNKTEADEIGRWSSNYSDKVGVWGSNYVLSTSNILVGSINDTSKYILSTRNILVGSMNDTSNYVLSTSNVLVGSINDTSNYALCTSNVLVGSINDTSNYVLSTSNILVGRTSDTSNILVGCIDDTSNYVARISTELTAVMGGQTTLTGSTLSGVLNTTDDFVYNATTTKIDLSKNTSNYVLATNNILVGRVNDTSNYVDRINAELTTVLTGQQATLTGSTLSGFLNTTDDFAYNAGSTKVDLSKNTSNYALATSNILVAMLNGRVTEFLRTIPKGNYTIRVKDYLDDYMENGVCYMSTFSFYKSDRYKGGYIKIKLLY
jgi:hypothetical protein